MNGDDNRSYPDCGHNIVRTDDKDCCPICYEPFPSASADRNENNEFTRIAHTLTDSAIEGTKSGHSQCTNSTENMSKDCTEDAYDIDVTLTANNGQNDLRCSLDSDIEQQQPQAHQNEVYQQNSPNERVTIPGCKHSFCRDCLGRHCSFAVSVRDLPIRCPACVTTGNESDYSGTPCPSLLPINLIKELLLFQGKEPIPLQILQYTNPTESCTIIVDSDVDNDESPIPRHEGYSEWIKFQRLDRMLKDSSLVPCTRCDELIKVEDKDDAAMTKDRNRVECPHCNHVFCRIHGDAHINVDCFTAATKRKYDRNEAKSEKVINKRCKLCSHCQVPIYKETGCNHIICAACGEDMCFKCGTHVHLTGEKVRKCSNCNGSYIDHRHLQSYRMNAVLSFIVMLPIHLVYIATSFSFAVATFACFCCLGCGIQRKRNSKTTTFEGSSQSVLKSVTFMPCFAVRKVVRFVFLPLVDLFNQLGIPCCFCGRSPDLLVANHDEDKEEEDDSDISSSVDLTYDVENQMKTSDTCKTALVEEGEMDELGYKVISRRKNQISEWQKIIP